MATAVASSHNSHHYRPAVFNSSSSPVVSPLSSSRRVRVNPSPACVARPAEDAADRRGHRAHDEKPRRTPSPSPAMRRRRRRDAYASPERKRRRGSDARADHYRRPDVDAHRRGRDDDAHRAADKTSKEGGERDRARDDDDTRRRSSSRSRSSKERRAPRALPSPAAHHHHRPAADSIARSPRALAVDDDRKRSPEKEVDHAAEDVEARRRRDELQRKREEARRELDKVVRTVWFNDPYISPTCVLNMMPRWSWKNDVEEGEVV